MDWIDIQLIYGKNLKKLLKFHFFMTEYEEGLKMIINVKKIQDIKDFPKICEDIFII